MDGKLIATVVGIATGIVAIATFIVSIFQRKKELRWKQAELARKLLDDLFENPDSEQGFYMLDGLKYPFKDFYGEPICVNRDDIVRSVSKTLESQELDNKEARILFCFDTLLYFINRIENSLRSGLILFEDICTPCEYYIGLMATNRVAFSQYMQHVGYVDLFSFCERFSSWGKD